MTSPDSSLIELRALGKTYRVGESDLPVLQGVTLDVAAMNSKNARQA